MAGRFTLDAQNRVHFALGAYNHAQPLVIDPVLVYSTYLGGSGGDTANAITVDAAGNAYVAGRTASTNFPVTPGAFQGTNDGAANGFSNAFITKLNPGGTALVYSTYLGGSGGVDLYGESAGDQGSGLAIDSSGNVYVTGEAVSSDFPVTPGAFQTTSPGQAAFVTKLNPTGTALVYSTFLGGIGDKYGWGNTTALAVDGSGDAYIAGATSSTTFPVTPKAFQTTNKAAANSYNNVFVTKLNPAGSALVYSTYLGGNGGTCCSGDMASGVAVDGSGNVYITGTAQSTDFPVTQGAYQSTDHDTANGGSNAFVTKLNPAGTALVYSTYLGGSGGTIYFSPTLFLGVGDQANGLAVDSSGNAYVTGVTASSDFPVTPGAYQTTNHIRYSLDISHWWLQRLRN